MSERSVTTLPFRDTCGVTCLSQDSRTSTFECPICLDTIEEETSVSWCRHTFCFPCILEWSRIRPVSVCPVCREPFRYLLRKVGDNNYEVYSIGHYTTLRFIKSYCLGAVGSCSHFIIEGQRRVRRDLQFVRPCCFSWITSLSCM
uniref:RING-type E3 ubiquitin transferase n=1 Tax=Ficedula albicollis TaxID=59894 RepID=A0A803VLL2_FICAL